MFGKSALALTGFGLLAAASPPYGAPPANATAPAGAVQTQDASQLISDPLTYGPAIELVHLYYDEWPTGTSLLSSTGN